jgi:ribonuclease R
VLPPEESTSSRGVNKKRAADESRSKVAAEKKRKEEIQKAKRIVRPKPATGSKMRTAAKKSR